MYSLLRSLLFKMDPEFFHHLSLNLLPYILPISLARYCQARALGRPVKCLGLEFPNPVGLAAGLDKDGMCIDQWFALGFGFVEVGTVTPRPQSGNPKPRLFRLPEATALINRFGFNNVGVDAFLQNIARTRWRGVLGINIGKNADTPVERAIDDYKLCLEKVYAAASYVTINVS